MKITKYKIILLVILIFGLISALFLLPDGVSVFAEVKSDETGERETSAVASVGDTEYSSLEQALSDWTDGDTLLLLANVSAERRIEVSGEKTLDLNGYTLQGTGSGRTVQVEGTLVLKDGSALKSGKISGGGVRVNGTLKMESGNITENSAEDGGGVYIAESGTFVMNGGRVTGNNTAYGTGGGIYVGGALCLGSMAVVTGNTDEAGVQNNIYLPAGKTIELSAFTGEAGVSSLTPATVARGEKGGTLKADNLIYTINYSDGVYSLALSPLASVSAQYKGEEIYPTTELQSLKDEFTITARNANGVNYAGQYGISLDGTLTIGGSDITLTVTGEGGERIQVVVTVSVSSPKLTGITALYDGENKIVYFDTALTSLQSALTVTGAYSDGYSRGIYPTADETAAAAQEEYITDYYTLSGDLGDHDGGAAEITVRVGTFSQTVSVPVSKYVIDVSKTETVPVTIVEQSAETLDPKAFVPSVPDGIEVIATLNGKALQASTLSAGVYTVEISFRVIDTDNYEEIEDGMKATLTVNYASISGGADEAEYTVQTEGGIPLNWDMTITEISSSVKLEGDMEVKQAVTITLREDGYIVTETDKSVTVRLLLAESLRGKDFVLYRVLSDGSTVEVAAQTDGDYVIFETAHLSGIEYVLAVNSGYGVYLALTIVFGIVCLAGAGLLIWYFKVRRNMSIK